MQSYQIYHRFKEVVQPLPKDQEALRKLKYLPYTGFACCSPCDGSSETPQVPVGLPRSLPKGTYTWGAYSDEKNLFVVMDAKEGASVPALMEREEALDQWMIFQPDGLWYRTLQIALNGEKQALSHPYSHQPNRPPCEEPDWDWSVERFALGEKYERTIWRIAQSNLQPHLRHGELRMSLSKTTIRSHEGVAWGSYGIWGPRFDECGTLVFESSLHEEPILRSVHLHCDMDTQEARLDLQWESIPPENGGPRLKSSEAWRESAWNRCSARVNHQMQSLPLESSMTVCPFLLKQGWNEIHINSRVKTHAYLFLEAVSSRELSLPEYAATVDLEKVKAWSDGWFAQLVATRTLPQRFQRWMTGSGTALAMRCRYDQTPDTWKNWVEKVGDYFLELQREDGTFSGFHLSESGRTDIAWRGGAYDSGQAGEFWVRAYQATHDERFLAASRRLLHAYANYRVEFNPNYAAFALYHLAAHYEVTREKEALEHAEYYLKWCVLPHLLPLGFHGGHNYYSAYAGIILRALALGYEMFPDTHPLKEKIRKAMVQMSNQAMRRLLSDGSFDSRDRHFVGETSWLGGLFAVYVAMQEKSLRPVLDFISNKAMQQTCSDTDWIRPNAARLACSPAFVQFLIQP